MKRFVKDNVLVQLVLPMRRTYDRHLPVISSKVHESTDMSLSVFALSVPPLLCERVHSRRDVSEDTHASSSGSTPLHPVGIQHVVGAMTQVLLLGVESDRSVALAVVLPELLAIAAK